MITTSVIKELISINVRWVAQSGEDKQMIKGLCQILAVTDSIPGLSNFKGYGNKGKGFGEQKFHGSVAIRGPAIVPAIFFFSNIFGIIYLKLLMTLSKLVELLQ